MYVTSMVTPARALRIITIHAHTSSPPPHFPLSPLPLSPLSPPPPAPGIARDIIHPRAVTCPALATPSPPSLVTRKGARRPPPTPTEGVRTVRPTRPETGSAAGLLQIAAYCSLSGKLQFARVYVYAPPSARLCAGRLRLFFFSFLAAGGGGASRKTTDQNILTTMSNPTYQITFTADLTSLFAGNAIVSTRNCHSSSSSSTRSRQGHCNRR